MGSYRDGNVLVLMIDLSIEDSVSDSLGNNKFYVAVALQVKLRCDVRERDATVR